MRIAICDDESICLEHVLTIAKQYAAERKEKNIAIYPFSQAEDLLEAAEKTGGFDIYILDIVMPFMNGIIIGTKLRDAGYDGKIIYLTSSEEYALDSFKVKAFNYMIKPCQSNEFFKTLDEAIASIETKKDKSIVIKAKDRNIKLTFHSILYAELAKRAIVYHLADGRSIETVSLRTNFSDSIAELLADKRFTLCGVGMAVNMDHIAEISNETVVFDNTEQAFLGTKNCRKLRNAWNEFLFDTED